MKLPPPLQRLYDLWMIFSKALGKVMSAILLTILWIVGFGIYAVIMKLIELLRMEEPKQTYWLDASPVRPDGMKQQF